MTRHTTSVRLVTGSLALGGALLLMLVLYSVMEDPRCRDTGGHFQIDSGHCRR